MSWGTVGKEVKTERNSHGGLVVQGPQERIYPEWDECHGEYGTEERWDLACFRRVPLSTGE